MRKQFGGFGRGSRGVASDRTRLAGLTWSGCGVCALAAGKGRNFGDVVDRLTSVCAMWSVVLTLATVRVGGLASSAGANVAAVILSDTKPRRWGFCFTAKEVRHEVPSVGRHCGSVAWLAHVLSIIVTGSPRLGGVRSLEAESPL